MFDSQELWAESVELRILAQELRSWSQDVRHRLRLATDRPWYDQVVSDAPRGDQPPPVG